MTFRMIVQLWNTNTTAIVSRDADLTENYMYISMKFKYFAGKFMYLIVLASNQLAVKSSASSHYGQQLKLCAKSEKKPVSMICSPSWSHGHFHIYIYLMIMTLTFDLRSRVQLDL